MRIFKLNHELSASKATPDPLHPFWSREWKRLPTLDLAATLAAMVVASNPFAMTRTDEFQPFDEGRVFGKILDKFLCALSDRHHN